MKRSLAALALLLVASSAYALTVCGPTGCSQGPFPAAQLFGDAVDATTGLRPTDDLCNCVSQVLTRDMAAWDEFDYRVQNLDADDTINFAIFNEAGTTKLFACTLNVTSTGAKTCTNSLATGAHPAGVYHACLGVNVVTTEDWQFNSSSNGYNLTSNFACAAGAIPATITPSTAAYIGTANIVGYLVDVP